MYPLTQKSSSARYENLIPLMLPVADLVKRSDPDGTPGRWWSSVDGFVGIFTFDILPNQLLWGLKWISSTDLGLRYQSSGV